MLSPTYFAALKVATFSELQAGLAEVDAAIANGASDYDVHWLRVGAAAIETELAMRQEAAIEDWREQLSVLTDQSSA